MSLKKYDVVENGYPTTLLLSDEDAAARGLTARDEPKTAPAPDPTKPPAKKTVAKKATAAAKKAPAKKAAPKPDNKARDDAPNKGA